MLKDKRKAIEIIKEMKLSISIDKNELKDIILNILKNNSDECKRLKNGEEKLIKLFMGIVMRETKGKYPPNIIIEILNKSIR